jgi:hypothetical protein
MKTNFPTMAELLDEFAAGMREHKQRQVALLERRALFRPHLALLTVYGLDRKYPAYIGETCLVRGAA